MTHISTVDIKTIKELRKKNKMTQEQLANLMSVSKSTITKWETGQRNITTLDLMKLAVIFHVPLDTLIDQSVILPQNDFISYLKYIGYKITFNPKNEFEFYIEMNNKKFYANEQDFKQVEDQVKDFIEFQMNKFINEDKK